MARVLQGYMTTESVDGAGDIVKADGVTFRSMPLPLLGGHDHKQPIGKVVAVKRVHGVGIIATAHIIPKGQSRTADDWWAAISFGAAVGLSIGFRPTKVKPNSTGGTTFESSVVHELSLVAVPCNSQCQAKVIEDTDDTVVRPATIKPKPNVVNNANAQAKKIASEIERAKQDLIAQELGFKDHADRVRKLASMSIKWYRPPF